MHFVFYVDEHLNSIRIQKSFDDLLLFLPGKQ